MKTTIYYFTGTGNSLMVSRHLSDVLGETTLIPIPKAVKDEKVLSEADCIGFVFPVYYFGIPLIVRDFLKKLEISSNKYLFCIATCGGAAGNTFKQVSELLKEKGAILAAGFKLVLPDNYILLYNPTVEEKQAIQFNAEKARINEIAKVIRNKEYTGMQEKLFEPSRLLAPILYSHTKKLGKDARKFWTNERCTSCNSCKQLCPVGNIEMIEGRPIWKASCQQCLACIHWCPKQAIEFGKGTQKRRRYRNPEVTLKDIIDSVNG